MKEQNVSKGVVAGITLTITSSSQPDYVEFKAFEIGTNNVVKMNGNDTIFVTPTKEFNTVQVLLEGGAILVLDISNVLEIISN